MMEQEDGVCAKECETEMRERDVVKVEAKVDVHVFLFINKPRFWFQAGDV